MHFLQAVNSDLSVLIVCNKDWWYNKRRYKKNCFLKDNVTLVKFRFPFWYFETWLLACYIFLFGHGFVYQLIMLSTDRPTFSHCMFALCLHVCILLKCFPIIGIATIATWVGQTSSSVCLLSLWEELTRCLRTYLFTFSYRNYLPIVTK